MNSKSTWALAAGLQVLAVGCGEEAAEAPVEPTTAAAGTETAGVDTGRSEPTTTPASGGKAQVPNVPSPRPQPTTMTSANGGNPGVGPGPDTENPEPVEPVEPEVGSMDGGVPTVPEIEPGSETPNESGCLEGITDFDKDGPFTFESDRDGQVKMWVPSVPEGCKVPVIHLANGTGASCRTYQSVLNRFASHGFLTTCYESAQTGAGTQGVEAFEKAMAKYPNLTAKRLGSTGHSQGGQAAFTVLQQSEAKWGLDEFVMTGLAIEPASGFGAQPPGGSWQSMYGKIKSPMFMFSGTADALVSAAWVARAYTALDDGIEAYNWSASGATHIPTPNQETAEVGVPWFRWKLLGDNEACRAFKALAGGQRWKSVSEQNARECK